MPQRSVSQSRDRVRRGIRSIRWHLGLAGASAVLLMLAFPRPGWAWLSYIALTPLAILAIRSASWRRLAWTSWLVFFIWWLVMVRWMVPVTAGGYVAMAAFEALFAMVAVLVLQQLRRRTRCALVLALPLVWVSLELLRGAFPFGGFSWYSLGQATLPYEPGQGLPHIAQIADLFGQYGVSFVVAMTSGLLADMLTLPLIRRRRGGAIRPGGTITAAFALWALTFFGSYFYGSFRLAQTPGATTPGLRVAVVQTNVPQSNKNAPTSRQEAENWRHLMGLAKTAATSTPRPALIVWPETMVPAPLNASALKVLRAVGSDATKYNTRIARFAQTHQVNLLVGAEALDHWKTVITPDGRERFRAELRFNSAYLYRSDGKQAARRYDKVHLVPFGEYIPLVESIPLLKNWFIEYLSPYGFDYTTDAGDQLTIFQVPGSARHQRAMVRFATPICFEDTVSTLCRRMIYGPDGVKRADLLVNLTNDGWFAGSDEPAQHEQVAAMRSIENRVPMVRSVNTGVSGFIDSRGVVGPVVEVHGRREDVAGTAGAMIRLDDRHTLYGKLGELPAVIVALLTLAWVVLSLTRRRRLRR